MTDAEGAAVGAALADALRAPTGLPLELAMGDAAPGDIVLRVDDATWPSDEAYSIEVTGENVTIHGATAAGLFYGTQTLRQLMPREGIGSAQVEGVEWKVPMVRIEDSPRFEWRGVMLDVARRFFGVDVLERLVDLAALYKLNRVHLHLTDDQGWRVPVDSWPRLTTIGGATESCGGPGGFYTKAELAALVEHASARFVTLVPEVDMPGHINAALASYAELNESGDAAEACPPGCGDIGFSSLWVGGPETERFVRDVVREVSDLFPGPYFHIGGDEAYATSEEDYATFVGMAQRIAQEQGKVLVGWEEIGAATVPAPFIVQHWLLSERVVDAVASGARMIASPGFHAYLDMKYDESNPLEWGNTWAGFVDVEKAYSWNPVLPGVGEADVMGVEAALWTGFELEQTCGETRDDIDFMIFPRLLGHAEIGWSAPEGRSWETYRTRLAAHGPRLEALGVNFFRSGLVDWEP